MFNTKGIAGSENLCFQQYVIFGITFDFTIQQPYVCSCKSYNVSPQITKLTIRSKEDTKITCYSARNQIIWIVIFVSLTTVFVSLINLFNENKHFSAVKHWSILSKMVIQGYNYHITIISTVLTAAKIIAFCNLWYLVSHLISLLIPKPQCVTTTHKIN